MSIEFSNGFSISKNVAAVVADTIAAQLSGAELTAYNNASVGSWVKVTQTQYNAVVSNVSGATKRGATDAEVAARGLNTGMGGYYVTFGDGSTPDSDYVLNSGEYIIAMISEAWNQNTGQTQLAYTTTFKGSTITTIGGQAGTSTGGSPDYYVRKAPTTAMTENGYILINISVTPNSVAGQRSFYTTNNGTSWTSDGGNNFAPTLQYVVTTTKSW